MRVPSYHTFAQVPTVRTPRSRFDISRRYKTAMSAGKLIPFFIEEVLPGDTFDVGIDTLIRMTSAAVAPTLDNIICDFQFWYCPNRLVWEHWNAFLGEKENPDDSTDYVVPTVVAGENGFGFESQFDYLGIPPDIAGLSVCALPFRMINLIWNKFYRPEYLSDSLPVPTDDGPDDPSTDKYSDLLWFTNRPDYFQRAFPTPQLGDPVNLPLGGVAPVSVGSNGLSVIPGTYAMPAATGNLYNVSCVPSNASLNLTQQALTLEPGVGGLNSVDLKGLQVDLSDATAATVNSLRLAFQLQLFAERSQLGGTRVKEIISTMFGVDIGDARLQLPEYLGGGHTNVTLYEVPQTSSTDSTTPQGNLAAFGLAKSKPVGFKKSFVEHGYIIGFVRIRTPMTYQQGLHRMWSRQTKYDFYWPLFAHLGEQPIFNKEIYAQGPSVKDDDGNVIDDKVFGYQERFGEYRYGVSLVTGKMRSTYATSLDVWHLAPKYDSLPELGEDFIKYHDTIGRITAVQDEPQFIFDSYISCYATRAMPLFGTPGRIDHIF